MVSLDNAIDVLRDLEVWAQFHAEEARKEYEQQLADENARLDAMFGVGQERYA